MRRPVRLVLVAVMAALTALPAFAQEPAESSAPKSFLRGFIEGGVALDRAGFDGGWRRPDLPNGVGENLSRYRIRGEIFFGREVDWGPVDEIFVLVEPELLMGDGNGRAYDFSATATGVRRRYGAGLAIVDWKIYVVTNLRWWARDEEAYGDGPGGLHSMVFVRSPDLELGAADSRWRLTGHVEVGSSWPRNEPDLGLRRPELRETGGYGDNYSRYRVTGEWTLRYRLRSGNVRDAFVIWEPDFHMGRTVPQRLYTWEPRFIGARVRLGAGVTLDNDWSLYLAYNNWHVQDDKAIGVAPGGEHLMLMVRPPAFEWRF